MMKSRVIALFLSLSGALLPVGTHAQQQQRVYITVPERLKTPAEIEQENRTRREEAARQQAMEERRIREEQEQARRVQEAKAEDERINGMSEETFMQKVRDLESGRTRLTPAASITIKSPTAAEIRAREARDAETKRAIAENEAYKQRKKAEGERYKRELEEGRKMIEVQRKQSEEDRRIRAANGGVDPRVKKRSGGVPVSRQ